MCPSICSGKIDSFSVKTQKEQRWKLQIISIALLLFCR